MYFVLKYNIFWNNNCFVKLINSPHICLTDHNCFFLLKRIIFEYTVLYFSLSLASRHHLVYCPLSLKALYLLHEVCILSAAIIVPNLHIYINSISNTLNLLRTLYHFWNTLYPNWFSWSISQPPFLPYEPGCWRDLPLQRIVFICASDIGVAERLRR